MKYFISLAFLLFLAIIYLNSNSCNKINSTELLLRADSLEIIGDKNFFNLAQFENSEIKSNVSEICYVDDSLIAFIKSTGFPNCLTIYKILPTNKLELLKSYSNTLIGGFLKYKGKYTLISSISGENTFHPFENLNVGHTQVIKYYSLDSLLYIYLNDGNYGGIERLKKYNNITGNINSERLIRNISGFDFVKYLYFENDYSGITCIKDTIKNCDSRSNLPFETYKIVSPYSYQPIIYNLCNNTLSINNKSILLNKFLKPEMEVSNFLSAFCFRNKIYLLINATGNPKILYFDFE